MCRASLLLTPPLPSSHHHPLSCPLGAGPPRPSLGYRRDVVGGTHRCAPVPRPHPPSITYHLSTLPLLALRPLGALRRRRRRRKEWGERRQQSQGRGVHGGFGGVSPVWDRRGGYARSQHPAGKGEAAQGFCLHRPRPRMGGAVGGRSTPQGSGTPMCQGTAPQRWGSLPRMRPRTLTRSPFCPLLPAVPGRPRSPFPPCKRREAWVTRQGTGVPMSTCVPTAGPTGPERGCSSHREGLRGRIPAGAGLCVSWGVTNLPLDPGDRA